MLIERTDIRSPVTIEFTGVFGETPAEYRFAVASDGRYVCDIADPIVVRRLLSIPAYVLANPGDDVPDGPEPQPVDQGGARGRTAPTVKIDMTAARAYYTEVVGKKPFPGWGADDLLKRIDAHIAGEPKDGETDADDKE